MTIKTWLALGAIILTLLAADVWLLYRLADARAEVDQATLRVTSLEAQVGALEARQKAIATSVQAVQARSTRNEQTLHEALNRAGPGVDDPVPGPVADGLCQFLTCAR